jgi:hypothetical protein
MRRFWGNAIQQSKALRSAVLNSNVRLLVTTAVVLAAKTTVVLYVYFRLGGISGFHTGFQDFIQVSNDHNPLYAFVSWDSYWYMKLGRLGYYPSKEYFAFFPAYPIAIHLLYILTHDELLSAVLPATIFGIAWIPIFQLIAEAYMDRESAMGCTLIASFFPIVFLYTTVAYAEGLLLFLSLLLWLLYSKGKTGWAASLLAIASLTKPFGVLFGLPMLIDLISKKKLRSMAFMFLPAMSLLGWFYYSYYSTGDWLAFRYAETTFWNNQLDWARGWIIPFLSGSEITFNTGHMTLGTLTIFMILIVAMLVLLTFQSDWRLGAMSLALYLAIISFSGPPEGPYVRYFSFIYPIWFIGKLRAWKLIAVYCALMTVHSAILWYEFLSFRWIS